MSISFKTWLWEMSYTQADVPSYFYVACSFNLDGLLARKLVGLDGLTSDIMHASEWVASGRMVILKMPSAGLLEVNKLTRIMYDNPDYMASKNADAWKRIAGNHDNGIIKMLINWISKALNINLPPNVYSQLTGITEFNNSGQVTKKIGTVLRRNGIVVDDVVLSKAVKDSLTKVPANFTREKEWRVKKSYQRIENEIKHMPVLNIPPWSELLIAWSKMNNAQRQEFQQRYFDLKDKYKVCVAEAADSYDGELDWEKFQKEVQIFDSGRY